MVRPSAEWRVKHVSKIGSCRARSNVCVASMLLSAGLDRLEDAHLALASLVAVRGACGGWHARISTAHRSNAARHPRARGGPLCGNYRNLADTARIPRRYP